jgi:putative oxidoreductase
MPNSNWSIAEVLVNARENRFQRFGDLWPIALRAIVGFGFMQHGYAKLARGPDDFAHILAALGVPFPALLAWGTIFVELIGGLAILSGAFVALASLPMAIVLVVAIVTVHIPNGFSSIKLLSVDASGAHFGQPGYETDLLYLASLIALVLGGSGPLSVDRHLKQRVSKERANQWLPPRLRGSA